MHAQVKALPLIIASVLLNTFAQIAIKKGLNSIPEISFKAASIIKFILTPWIMLCLFCYALSLITWVMVLNLVEVTYAYPFLALGFLANAILAQLMLGEQIQVLRWYALAIITLGVALQAMTC